MLKSRDPRIAAHFILAKQVFHSLQRISFDRITGKFHCKSFAKRVCKLACKRVCEDCSSSVGRSATRCVAPSIKHSAEAQLGGSISTSFLHKSACGAYCYILLVNFIMKLLIKTFLLFLHNQKEFPFAHQS